MLDTTISTTVFIIVSLLVPLTSIVTIYLIKFFLGYNKFDPKIKMFLGESEFTEDVEIADWRITGVKNSNGHAIAEYSTVDKFRLQSLCIKNGIDPDSTLINNVVRRDIVTSLYKTVYTVEGDEVSIAIDPFTGKDIKDMRCCSKQMTKVRAEARIITFDHYTMLKPNKLSCICSLEMADNLKAAFNPTVVTDFNVLFDYCKRDTTVNVHCAESGNVILGTILYYQHWAKEMRRQLNGRFSP